ncbi:hypothetical protein [Deinococcus maricopensis]|nr:hypothetical protein [Deinococcus maricopensis]
MPPFLLTPAARACIRALGGRLRVHAELRSERTSDELHLACAPVTAQPGDASYTFGSVTVHASPAALIALAGARLHYAARARPAHFQVQAGGAGTAS